MGYTKREDPVQNKRELSAGLDSMKVVKIGLRAFELRYDGHFLAL